MGIWPQFISIHGHFKRERDLLNDSMLGVYRIFRQAQICWYSNNTSCGVEKIQYPVWHFFLSLIFIGDLRSPPFLWWKIHVLSLLVPWPQSVVGHWESQKRLGTRTVSQSIPCSRCMTATPEYRMIQSCGLVWKSTNFIIFILFFEIPFTQTSTTTKLDDTTKELKELGTVSTTYNVADFSLQIYSVRIPRLLQK